MQNASSYQYIETLEKKKLAKNRKLPLSNIGSECVSSYYSIMCVCQLVKPIC
jgi:hypothetical protein